MENKKTVVVYDSFYEAIQLLSTDEARVKLFNGMMQYGLTGIEPTFETSELKLSWVFYKPNMDSNIKRYNKAVSNGKKGGEAKALNKDTKRVAEVLPKKEIINEEIESNNLLEILESGKQNLKAGTYLSLQSAINKGQITKDELLIQIG